MQSLADLIHTHWAKLPDLYPRENGAAPAVPPPPANPIRSTRKATQWRAAIYRAYGYMTERLRDPSLQTELDRYCEQTLAAGPDFLKVRREADFRPVPVVTFTREAAAEIMRQAREIERETYARRAKGKHGGALGRMAMQLLEWFCFGMWPRAPRGMFPSLARIAAGSRMSKDTVIEAMKTLQLFGFLTVQKRRKRIATPLGVKMVQDTNAYVLGFAKGLGALALTVFAPKPKSSESTKPPAKENLFLHKRENERIFGNSVTQPKGFNSG